MHSFSAWVVRHKKAVSAVFLLLAAVSVVLLLGVKVNYNMADYLPPSAQSTRAVAIMEEEFTQAVPNASVLVPDVGIPEALEMKEQLAGIEGVAEVLWLDDTTDVMMPLSMQDKATVEGFYKDGSALYSVSIEEGHEAEAVRAIRTLVGEGGAVSGEACETEAMQGATGTEVRNATLILVPAILIILLLTTTSWLEPLLFFAAIGVSILINLGTNLFFGEVSFVTNSVGPILQLAVSLDYAIFLLHSFADYRAETDDVQSAMRRAMRRSLPAVAASALTTLFGFLALSFMQFRIGADLGINLAKGIVLSFVSCMVFLPAFTLLCLPLLDKTRHRPLAPAFRGAGRVLGKLAVPVTLAVVLLVVPSFLGQQNTVFTYGSEGFDPGSRAAQDTARVEDTFGKSTLMAVLVPRGDVVKEAELGKALEGLDHVTGVVSYAASVGTGIPSSFLDEAVTAQFYSDNYARLVVYTNTPYEGDLAFATVEDIMATAHEYYDTVYAAGQSANLYDMREVVAVDNLRVNLIAIIAIFLVLVVTFRSGSLPFVLLFTIEAGIWINLAIPYFMGESINFLGYLVVNTVQLGATVDYAILLTSYYTAARTTLPRREAVFTALGQSFRSILVSAATLTIAGFTLAGTSSNPAVAIIGQLLGRGTILSFVLVVCMLPLLLFLLDPVIGATTWRANFYRKPKPSQDETAKGDAT